MQLITRDNYDSKYGDIFIMLEMEILKHPQLTHAEKIIYAVIKNKFHLSIQNNYMNKNGEYFVYLTQKEIAEIVGCSEKTVYNAFQTLSGKNKNKPINPLIKLDDSETNTYRIYFYQLTGEYGKYERRGVTEQSQDAKQQPPVVDPKKPNIPQEQHIPVIMEIGTTPMDYLLAMAESEITLEAEKFDYSHVKITGNEEIFTTRKKEQPVREFKKSNNNSIYHSNNTPNRMIDRPVDNFRQKLSFFKEQIAYHDLIQTIPDKQLLDEFCLNAVDMLMSDNISFKGSKKPLSIVEAILSRFTYAHMEEAINRLTKWTGKITDMSSYMKSILYDVGLSFKADIDATVRHDMPQLAKLSNNQCENKQERYLSVDTIFDGNIGLAI